MIEIIKSSEVEQTLNILLYGDTGAGKTTLASTAAEHKGMREVLFLNIEGGMLSVRGRKVNVTKQISSIDQAEEVLWEFAQENKQLAGFGTLIVDSGTELQSLNLEAIVQSRIQGASKDKKKELDENEIFMEDYGKSTTRLKRFFRLLRDLPCHTIVTALPKRVYRESTKAKPNAHVEPVYVGPSFTSKLAVSVMGYMDCVWYIEDDNGTRKLLTEKDGAYQAKTRGNRFAAALGGVVEKPNLATLYDTLLKTEG